MVERSLLTPEIRGSNPDIGEILSAKCTVEKTKIKKKRPGMARLKKSLSLALNFFVITFFVSQIVFKELGVGRNSLKLEKPIE